MPPEREAFLEYFKNAPESSHFSTLRLDSLPRHIAIIMDGNGRWAKQRGHERGYGHAAGVDALKETITACVRLGIEVLTVYAFSTENWNRPQSEVDLLMSLFAKTLIAELPLMMEENVRLRYLGDMENLPQETRETFELGLTETAANTGLVLAVAVNYGSRAEMLRATRALAARCVAGEIAPEDIDETMFSEALYTASLPDPDLLIRTSGECRISNFLMWQISYTELVFLDELWPDFDRWSLVGAIAEFQRRHRRFGGVEDEE